MSAVLAVRPLLAAELDAALPLIAAYQRFYGAPDPDDGANRAFFSRFLEPSELGLLLGAWSAQRLVGFGCLYWTHSSVRARDVALLNDLFVTPDARGAGAGRALIDAAANSARARGLAALRWMTAPANDAARRLYDATGAGASEWLEYELALA